MASSTNRDRGTRTLPLQTHEAPQNESVNEIIDGELVDEDGQRPPRRTAPDRSGRDRSEREKRRNEQWDARRKEKGMDPLPTEPMTRLRLQMEAAASTYMASVRRSSIQTAKLTPKERTSQLTGLHKAYASMMVLSCLDPLKEGVNAKSVCKTVGMSAALWMLSPNFRDMVGDLRTQIRPAINEMIQERKESKQERVFKKTDKKLDKGKSLSRRWEKKRDKAERAQRGDRDAYTAKSAGMTEVALVENAYAAMRVEGADVDAIRDTHDQLIKTLYEQAESDGVDAADVAKAARVVVGFRLEEDPNVASVFGELAHGKFAKSDPREVRISGTDETATVWTGEFESRFGQPVEAGSFGLRSPMNADQHQVAIAETMTEDMISLTRQHGVDGLNMGVVSYAAAWGLKDRPEYEGMLAMDNPLGERLRSSRLMMATMDADGISAEEKQRIYSNAYVDAMEMLATLHPDVEEQWGEKFGQDWKGNMRDFVSDPSAYMDGRGAEWDWEQAGGGSGQEGPSAREAGPARSTRTYRTARINQNYIETSSTGVAGFGSDSSDFRDPGFEMGG